MANIKKEFDAFLGNIKGASTKTQNEIDKARKLLNQDKIQIEQPNKDIDIARQEVIDVLGFIFSNHPELLTIYNAEAAKKLAKRIGYKGPEALDELDHPTLKNR